MDEVALAARLTRQAVYLHFRSRTALMLALVDHVGDKLGATELFQPQREAGSARAALRRMLAAAARYAERVHDVASALDHARHGDAAAQAAWQDRMARRRREIRKIVARLASERALRPDWSVARAVDALWALTAPRGYADLVVARGWSLADYERYLVTTAGAFLKRTR